MGADHTPGAFGAIRRKLSRRNRRKLVKHAATQIARARVKGTHRRDCWDRWRVGIMSMRQILVAHGYVALPDNDEEAGRVLDALFPPTKARASNGA